MPRGYFPRKPRNQRERFFEKVRIDPSGCWIWEGSRAKAGYGTFNLGRRGDGYTTAHEYTYSMLFGPVPSGYELDHLCRQRCCCNPWHVEAVTHRVNHLRGMHPAAVTHRSGICKRGHALSPKNFRGAECRRCAYLRHQAPSMRLGPLSAMRICALCTQPFLPHSGSQKLCSVECRRKAPR